MTLDELRTLLAALRRERLPFVARQHADALRAALTLPWIDARLASEMAAALSPHGSDAPWRAPELRVGETYLLVCTPGTRRGDALRWRSVTRDANALLTPECESVLDRAWRGLWSSAAEVGHGQPDDFSRGGFDAPALPRAERIDGASLGVSACIAWLSRACGVAPASDVAASAEVRSDGRLGPVEMLSEKLTALRAQWPDVTRVVISTTQELEQPLPSGVALIRCATVREAFAEFGLSLDPLPECSIEEHLRRLAGFRAENARSHDTATWRDLSTRAWTTAQALSHDETERMNAGRARAWAALFALHAGDDQSARELSREVGEVDDPSVAMWLTVVAASAAIDRGHFEEALTRAQAAVRDAHKLPAEHRWIEGHARGTVGRALLHAGRHDEAREALGATMQWFLDRKEPWEAARTSKDIATSLRLDNRSHEAVSVIERGFAWLDEVRPRREVSAKTRDFLTLERGRCLLAVGRTDEALRAFERVVGAQGRDHDYPRLGALRGMVVASRRLGRNFEASEYLERCLAVARERSRGDALGRVAAFVAAEALVDGDAEAVERARTAWAMHFGDNTNDAMRAALARQVY